jgi:hypothetical protein
LPPASDFPSRTKRESGDGEPQLHPEPEFATRPNAKGVGAGVQEYRIEWGPGYRLYFGQDGDTLIILLCGGTKRRQQDDVADAQAHWAEYKRRKKEEG